MNRLFKIFLIVFLLLFIKADITVAREISQSNEYQIVSVDHNENVIRRTKNNNAVLSNLINIGIKQHSKRNNLFADFGYKPVLNDYLCLAQIISNKDFLLNDKHLKELISFEILPNAP